ncbi:hypothetical protein G9G63_08900 [Paenibacillus sp. EKM202P]|uniref:hypothetical protein n=1 Tax=unclassified Paenibacillus TaxID=185978 RepID=UPI0013EC106B|nr:MULTISPECIES: hypothetical protein [unclassified Paenibacillus]KAF6565268.1 hypothetical protein G9G63_08900 [Paenibacillus sp. EKM202P]KAF6569406.1 hypothetical protein G9G64_13190 [Paenibacillus sp. EKM207P]
MKRSNINSFEVVIHVVDEENAKQISEIEKEFSIWLENTMKKYSHLVPNNI